MPAFSLNAAVDQLLKREFDTFRRLQQVPPLLKTWGLSAIPFAHPLIDEWRDPFKGVQYHHKPTNFIVFGAVDDLWIDPQGRILVVDYKATSTEQPISLDNEYRQAYKRQMEIYQWLLRKQKLVISDTGYFVYCNADKTRASFEARLEFAIELIAYEGHDDWVEDALQGSHQCLLKDTPPDYKPDCPYCRYLQGAFSLSSKPSLEFQQELF